MTTPHPGFFTLRTVADLHAKLRRDLERLRAAPLDVDMAFNFFVTGWSLLEWVYPGRGDPGGKRAIARNASKTLQICEYLATGAKHFLAEDKRHQSIAGTAVAGGGGMFPVSMFPATFFPRTMFGPPLRQVVTLAPEVDGTPGRVMGVLELAADVMRYWDAELATEGAP